MTAKNSLYLIGMKITNILKIENFDYQFDGKSVKLAGPNASGKTTLLRAIWAACLGKAQVPDDVINDGKEKGEIEINLGELTIKRTFTAKDTYLTVTMAGPNGSTMKASNPQKILDSLVGEIALDPHAFMETASKKQAEMAGQIFGVSEKLATIDSAIKAIYDERTYVNRKCKDLEGELRGTKPEPITEQPVDLEELRASESQFTALDIEYREASGDLRRSRQEAGDIDETIASLEKQLRDKKQRQIEALKEVSEGQNRVETVTTQAKQLPDRETLKQQITEGQELNSRITISKTQVEAWGKRAADLDTSEEKSTELSLAIDELKAERGNAIASAKIPVSGLGFEDGLLIYNGHPLDNASHAEQLRVSIAILMSQEPSLKLLTIKDASLMDSASWKVVEELAEQHKFQVLYEIVSDSPDSAGLYLDDGVVTHVDGKVVEKIPLEEATIVEPTIVEPKEKAEPKRAPRSKKEADDLKEQGSDVGLFE